MSEIPQWQCHKIVQASKIIAMDELGKDDKDPSTTCFRWWLECGIMINVSKSLASRGYPNTGDYYVLYADGYESWSPAKAFEEGYTKLCP